MTPREMELHLAVIRMATDTPHGLRLAVRAIREDLDEARREGTMGLLDTLDDLDAYCERCDDTGTVEEVRHAHSSSCDPADVTEVPCGDCEAARVLAEKRAHERRRDEHSGVARG